MVEEKLYSKLVVLLIKEKVLHNSQNRVVQNNDYNNVDQFVAWESHFVDSQLAKFMQL